MPTDNNHEPSRPIIAVTGPTASGKTRRAVSLAKALDGEIVSADSRQVYRGMDIGTGKDIEEYGAVPCHLVNVADAGYKYNLFEYVRDAKRVMEEISSRHRLPIVCGGSGLYLETLLNSTNLPEVPSNPELRASLANKNLDELKDILQGMKRLHNITDVDTKQRAVRAIEIQKYYEDHPETLGGQKGKPLPALIVMIDIDRDSRRRLISERLDKRLSQGMVDEVRRLLDSGIKPDDLIYYGLEYKFLTLYLTGQLDYNQMRSQLEIAIHQFAKRQMTWFRGMERRGFQIHKFPFDMPDEQFVEAVSELYLSSR